MIEALIPNSVSRLIVYLEPVNMRWGPDRIGALCRDELRIDPDLETAFIFTNKKRDCLLLYCVDDEGDRVVQKKLDTGAFLLPAPDPEGAPFVSMKIEMLPRLFRS